MKKIITLLCLILSVYGFSQSDRSIEAKSSNERFSHNIQTIETDYFDVEAQIATDAFNKASGNKHLANRFGYEHYVSHDINNSGTWTTTEDGGKVWRLGVKSEGALSLNLIFNDFYLAEGATLHFYSKDKSEIIGAFTNANNNINDVLGTDLIKGEEGIIELYEPAAVFGQSRIQLGTIVHGYVEIQTVAKNMMKALNTSGDCNMDVNCLADDGSGWELQRNCVAMLVNGGGFCTGSLINNTANDGTPYFVTANHCGGAQNATVFRFRWESDVPDCATTANSPNGPENMNVNGSVLRATIEESDLVLVELNSAPNPAWNIYYNGWDNSDVTGNVSNTRGIHHPDGDIKKICVDNQAPTQQNTPFNGFNTDVWRIADWDQGVTEPGSSGSPLFRQDGKTIGVLSGGAAACNGTNDNNQYDIYGRLGAAWEPAGSANNAQLKVWLDPTNTGITEIEGYDPNAPTNPDNAAIAGIIAPDGNYCDETITPEVTLRNAGSNNLTTVTITYQVDGGTNQTFNWTGNLAPNATENVTLNAVTVATGAHTFTATSSLPNGVADTNTGDDSASSNFTILPTSAIPVMEGFETAALPAAWSIFNGDNGQTWEREANYGGYGTSNACYIVDNWNYNGAGQYDWLLTDYYDFSSVVSPELTFDLAYAYYDGNAGTFYDSLAVVFSTDCGATYSAIYFEGGANMATAGGQAADYDFAASEWSTETLDLSALVGESSVQFGFVAICGYGNTLAIDNINISSSIVDADNDGFDNTVDCDDNNAAINPNATEVCDGIDNNCDGNIDEGLTNTYYADADNDGFGDASTSTTACTQPTGFVTNSIDCDDTNAAINPNATEICDGIDNNCDGDVDEGLTIVTYYTDADNDGFGDATSSTSSCTQPAGTVTNNTDCDDTNSAINPNATDIPNNGIDEDCSGSDEINIVDADNDGFNNTVDCDDTNAAINPNATEICDGIDNNCDGNIDEGVTNTYYADTDNDGFGDASSSVNACSQPAGFITNNTDCDDTNAAINPNATDIANNGIDEDCNGSDFVIDNDNDGFNSSVDCDDTNAAVNPSATEICDGIDNNCDGNIDEGVTNTYYADMDNDGFGDAAVTATGCSAPAGFVSNNTDCDDTNAAINPNATDIPDNGIDEDCNGSDATNITDADNDGFDSTVDCDDTNAAVNPGATEICDGIDNNCDGNIDEGLTFYSYFLDNDNDGFGDINNTITNCNNTAPTGYVANATDCNDNDPAITACQVGINDIENIAFINLYPNPTNESINLNLSLIESADIDVKIINTIGQMVDFKSMKDYKEGIEVFNLNAQSDGIYFIQLISNNETKTLRFLKSSK